MTSQEYLAELEQCLDRDDPRSAYNLWLHYRDARLDTGLSTTERRRLQSVLHIILQIAAELRWDRDVTVGADAGRRTA